MDEAFIENAKNDVDSGKGSQDPNGLIFQRILESLRGALKGAVHGLWDGELQHGLLDVLESGTERGTLRKVKGNGNGRENSLMVDGKRAVGMFIVRERTERYELSGIGR